MTLLIEFQRVGRGLPLTTSHSASIFKLLYLTSIVGNATLALPQIDQLYNIISVYKYTWN